MDPWDFQSTLVMWCMHFILHKDLMLSGNFYIETNQFMHLRMHYMKGHSVAQLLIQEESQTLPGFSTMCKCKTWILKTFIRLLPPPSSMWPGMSFSPKRKPQELHIFLSLLSSLNWHCSKLCLVSWKFKNPCWKKLQLPLLWSSGARSPGLLKWKALQYALRKEAREINPKQFITVVSVLSWHSVKSNTEELWRNVVHVFNMQIDIGCKVNERCIPHWSTFTGALLHI